MKSYFYSLLILTISFKVLSAQKSNQMNLCEENDGNIQMKTAFRFKSHLFFFAENGKKFKVNDFKWTPDTNEFTYAGVEALDPDVWNTTNLKLTSIVDHPTKGLRVLEVDYGMNNSIPQLLAYFLEVEEKSGSIINKTEFVINIYKCSSFPEIMNLCMLFAKFPQLNIEENLISMTSFPQSTGSAVRLPKRFFVYFRETPQKKIQEKKCPGCYKSKRYIMIRKNSTQFAGHIRNETNWRVDNSSANPCVDLKGVIVNASLTLTDYIQSGQDFHFDLLEFSGTTYTISRVQISSDGKVSENLVSQKSGPIGELFKCKQPPTTPTTLTTESETTQTRESDETPPEVPEVPEVPKLPSDSPELPPDISPDDRETTPKGMPTPTSTSTSKSKKGGFPVILIILIIVLVVVIIGVILWLIIPRGKGSTPPPPPPDEPSPAPPGPRPGPEEPKPAVDSTPPPPPPAESTGLEEPKPAVDSTPAPPPAEPAGPEEPGPEVDIDDNGATTPSDTKTINSDL